MPQKVLRTFRGPLNDRRQPAHPARAPPSARPQLAALHDRAALGVVDRRADDPRPHAPRSADRAADPLDAEPAGTRTADEGDPAEVQARQAEAERGADEVLQGEPHKPGRVLPADPRPVPGLHRSLLHAPDLFATYDVRTT